jgi:hypothetical protein
MTTELTTAPTRRVHLLAAYTLEEGTRIIVGQIVEGVARLTDRPYRRRGRSYVIESGGISDYAEVRALVADYKAEAARLGDCPMRASLINLGESDRVREALS